jgi:hypothetical protein
MPRKKKVKAKQSDTKDSKVKAKISKKESDLKPKESPEVPTEPEVKENIDSNTELLNASENTLYVDMAQGSMISDVRRVKFDGATERHTTTSDEEIMKRIASCREAYENSGIIGNVIDLMVDFALEGFTIFHENKPIQRFYQQWATLVGLYDVSEQILKSYFRDGTVPVLSFNGKIRKNEFNKLQKAIAQSSKNQNLFVDDDSETKVIPYAYNVLDVLNLEKNGSELFGSVRYEYSISADDQNILQNPKTEADKIAVERLKLSLSESDFNHLKNSGKLILPNNRLKIISYKKDSFKRFANPMLWRVIDDVKFKKLLRDMDVSVAENVLNVLTIISLGDTRKGYPPTKAMFERFAALLKKPPKSKTFLWNDLVDVKQVYPPVEKILGKEKYEQVDADIRAGLGIAEVILNGEGTNFANSFLSVKTLLERLKGGRNELMQWLMAEVISVAKSMKFKKPAWIKMRNMTLTDEEAEKRLLLDLVDRGMVSYQTCVERFGENFEIEVQRMKEEDSFRKRNEERFPFTLVKVGKFGPNIANGPIPVFSLLDQNTVTNVKKELPTSQEGEGEEGGRPQGTRKPQSQKVTPRAEPKGQNLSSLKPEDITISSEMFEVGEKIYDKLYKILSKSLIKIKKYKNENDLTEDDKEYIYQIISKSISFFDNHKDVSKDKIEDILNNVLSPYNFSCSLDGKQQVPPNNSNGGGHGKFVFDPITCVLNYYIECSDFSTDEIFASIQLGQIGENGKLLFKLNLGDNKSGSVILEEDIVDQLEDGNLFINICTSALPQGEIRGQIEPEIKQVKAPAILDRCVAKVEKSLTKRFRKKNNRSPSTKEKKEITSSAFAICRSSLKL